MRVNAEDVVPHYKYSGYKIGSLNLPNSIIFKSVITFEGESAAEWIGEHASAPDREFKKPADFFSVEDL
jgi:hypothetical protein